MNQILYSNGCPNSLKAKRIKIPDKGYNRLIANFYPTEKYLKRNDRKLVAPYWICLK